MRTLIIFGTVEGQTGKIARFVGDCVRESGGEAVLCDATQDEPVFERADKIILAGSVHERRHPKAFETLISQHRDAIAERPTLLLSVSLSAAFQDRIDEAQDYADEMKLRTGLNPTCELLVAGAIRTESYDDYAARVLQQIVLRGEEAVPAEKDHEFTDWFVLAAVVQDFIARKPVKTMTG